MDRYSILAVIDRYLRNADHHSVDANATGYSRSRNDMEQEHDEWVVRTIAYVKNEIALLRELHISLLRQIGLCERLLASLDSWYDVVPTDFETIFRQLLPRLDDDVRTLLRVHSDSRYARFKGVNRAFRPICAQLVAICLAWDSRSQDDRVLAALETIDPAIPEFVIRFLESLVTGQLERIRDGLDRFVRTSDSLGRDIANRDWYRLRVQRVPHNLDELFAFGTRSRHEPLFIELLIKAVSENLCARVLDPADPLKIAIERGLGIDERKIRESLPSRSFNFDKSSLKDLRFLVVKLLYAYGRRTDASNLSARIADELNLSKRTVERLASDKTRSFETIVKERLDLAQIAYEIYLSIVRPRTVVSRGQLGPGDLSGMRSVSVKWLATGERIRLPKSPDKRRARALRIYRNSIANLAKVSPAELTLENALRVLGDEAPNADSLDELLEALANRDLGRSQQKCDTSKKIGVIGRKVVTSTTRNPIPIAEVDARLEAEVLGLSDAETEQYVRGQFESRETEREIHERIERFALEFGPGTELAAALMGYEIEDIQSRIEEWNRNDPRERRGLVLADFFSVPRQLRLQLRFRKDEGKVD